MRECGRNTEQAAEYVRVRAPETTVFEGAATSDPVAVEAWTGSLARAIGFFARLENAAFRFATSYTDVDGLLDVDTGEDSDPLQHQPLIRDRHL